MTFQSWEVNPYLITDVVTHQRSGDLSIWKQTSFEQYVEVVTHQRSGDLSINCSPELGLPPKVVTHQRSGDLSIYEEKFISSKDTS